MTRRPFRFGVQARTAESSRGWADLARRAEELGYATLTMPDHFDHQLAPVPALMAAAGATSTLRVGSLVFDNDYRHPLVLAKELATIDVLSDGRLDFGLGAGWMKTDYDESGIVLDRPGVRVDRMEEAITVIRGLLTGEPFSFAGAHYTITNHTATPRPVQARIPLLVGGGQERVLSIAGREADIVGINPTMRSGAIDAEAALSGRPDETDQKLAWVREAAGARYDEIEIAMSNFAVEVTDDPDGVAAQFAPLFGVAPADVRSYPHALLGPVDLLVDALQERRERWDASYVVVPAASMEAFAPVVARLAGT